MIVRDAQSIKGIGFNPISRVSQPYAAKNQKHLNTYNKLLQTQNSSPVPNLTPFAVVAGILFILGGAASILKNKHSISNVLKSSSFSNKNNFKIEVPESTKAAQTTVPEKSLKTRFSSVFQSLKNPFIKAQDFTPEPVSWNKNEDSKKALKYLGYELLGMLGLSGGGYALHLRFKKPEHTPSNPNGSDWGQSNPLNLNPHVPLQLLSPPPGRRTVGFVEEPTALELGSVTVNDEEGSEIISHLEYARRNNSSYPNRFYEFDPAQRGARRNSHTITHTRNPSTGIWTEIRRWNPDSEIFENVT